MTVLPYGDRALLVELGSAEEVVRYVDALAGVDARLVEDVVPGARTVLVVGRQGVPVVEVRGALATSLEAIRQSEVSRLGRGRSRTSTTHLIEVPVAYDGPDLAEVARLTGLDEAGVVAAHTGAVWRVAFGGFAPGFAYLVGGDPRLHVPRRDQPRTSVPAGSVGLAAEFSGIYPRSSPGGWQLIGRTDLVLWDLDRDPAALLAPGATVRFVEA